MIVAGTAAPPRFSGFSALRFALLMAVAAVVIASISDVAPSPERLVNGVPRMAKLVSRMLPPETDPDFLLRVFWRLVETFQIAIAGTVLGIAISLPIAWMSARGITPVATTTFLFKGLVSFFRTVPDLVWRLFSILCRAGRCRRHHDDHSRYDWLLRPLFHRSDGGRRQGSAGSADSRWR